MISSTRSAITVAIVFVSLVVLLVVVVLWTTSPLQKLSIASQRKLRRTQSHSCITFGRNRSLVMGIQLERTIYKVPSVLDNNLINWQDRPASLQHSKIKQREIPIFWHILKSGGTTMKLMYATCYNLVEACETGGWIEAIAREQEKLNKLQAEEEMLKQQIQQQQNRQPETSDAGAFDAHQDEIQKSQEIMFANLMQQQNSQSQQSKQNNPQRFLQEQWQLWQASEQVEQNQQQELGEPKMPLRIVDAGDGRKYVNVDITTPSGIQNALDRGFASSNLADVIFTPLLVEATAKLFDGDQKKGRLFSVFRHPVDRVTSLFSYLQNATWEPTYDPIYQQWTIEDYVKSPMVESNWMVRSLVNKLEGPLDPDDVKVAKEILRQKCLIGLVDHMEESVMRFHKYFGFDNDAALDCAQRQYASKGEGGRTEEQNRHSHSQLDPNGEIYELLAKKNRLDIVLYEYAVRLFDEQGKWMKYQKLI